MAASKPIIKLENVWKTYQMGSVQVNALRGMDLEINEGEFVSIMGPSGSGKSTAMHMIGALDIPTKGNIFVEGKNIANFSESNLAALRGKKVGFIFQTFNLFGSLSALENVTIAMTFQRLPEAKRKQEAIRLLKAVGLEKRMNHKPGELSGGERQRVAVARALANDPPIIIADEPTGNLDSKTGESIMEMLQNLQKKFKKTLIVITHDIDVAKKAQKIYKLRDGVIIQCSKGRNC